MKTKEKRQLIHTTRNEMRIQTLKSQAYDCIAQIEFLQKQLSQINQEIAKEVNVPPTKKPKKDTKK